LFLKPLKSVFIDSYKELAEEVAKSNGLFKKALTSIK
jgi:hypothetical protein